MNAGFLTAAGLVVLAVWALLNSIEGLSETADVIFTVTAALLGILAAWLSLPATRGR